MTKTWARRSAQAGAIAAGVLLFTGGMAQAADMTSAGNNGIANGNQAEVPIQIPINFCGNAIAVLGVAGAGCDGGSSASNSGTGGDMTTVGNNGIANGNQLKAPIQVPINICGNAIAVLGVAGAGCDGGSSADIGHHTAYQAATTEAAPTNLLPTTLPGTDTVAQTADQATSVLPVDQLPGTDAVGGLTGALPTGGLTSGGLTNGMSVPTTGDAQAMGANAAASQGQPSTERSIAKKGTDMLSAGNNGILNGTQLAVPVQVPVDVSGNAIAVAGASGAGSTGGSSASNNG